LLTELLDWLRGLPEPALVGATGLVMLAECTIGLGVLVPGESVLLLAATTVDSVPRFLVLWTVVAFCACLGDTIGYAVGRRFGPDLRDTKLIKRHGAEAWDKTTDILRRRGPLAVFFARFLPAVRTLMPAAAGTSDLPFRRFAPAVIAGAVCWSALHIGLGIALGEAAHRIESVFSIGGTVVIGGVVVAVIAILIVKKRRRAKQVQN
jgi:membrane-associated protein